jgi:hypothetical protein
LIVANGEAVFDSVTVKVLDAPAHVLMPSCKVMPSRAALLVDNAKFAEDKVLWVALTIVEAAPKVIEYVSNDVVVPSTYAVPAGPVWTHQLAVL